MNQIKLVFWLVLLPVLAGLVGVKIFTVDPVQIEAKAQAVSDWIQVNSNGFNNQKIGEVSALEPFSGQLYAGTSNPTDGAQIFRSPDGLAWTSVTEPGFGNPHDTAPPAILDMMVFNGRLYASTGRGNAAQIWRTLDGTNWSRVVNAGFGDPDIIDITALAEYNGLIYAGATHAVAGAQIWRSYNGDSNSWTQVAPAVAGTTAAAVTGLAVFDGALYAAVSLEDGSPAQIWRSYGGVWTTIVNDGFGDSDTTMTGGMAEFGGYLYVGAGNTVDGTQLWRTNDGSTWEQMLSPGLGDTNNQKVEMVFTFQNQLYASTKNGATGIEIWRSANGMSWEQANPDGFGDSNNANTNWGNATSDFLGQLYVGTSNTVAGGELWRMKNPFDVDLSSDDSLTGSAGQTVTYTLMISNTGTTTDTYTLAISGNSWPTVLSLPSITVNPETSIPFTVTVTIPANAPNETVDAATLSATSQTTVGVMDSAVLTTTCVDLGQKVYLPVVLRSP